ncbi:unnamed protein product [Rhizoctonia solani]|uniref:Uncharacterized protein n=1 Tax=Rhizoctonia solani TaxID=456999 RepID=A0A8H3DJ80_9AGAM|nr:unnamed protein product [Rhizoctonia solani]
MRLSTSDQSEFETVRMEDVVFTLNNIVDDISRMYAGSFDDVSLDDSPMEIDIKQLSSVENKSQQEINPSARPDSPTLSEPPTSARSTASSDSEDTVSLYSASLGPSPVSSGFTTPSSSPTSLTFITDKDTTDWHPVSIHPLVGVDGNLPHVSSNVQIETWTLLKPMAGIDTTTTTTYAPTGLSATSSGLAIAYISTHSKVRPE